MWEIAIPIVLGAAAVTGVLQQARRRQQSWEEAMVSCGLEVVETSLIRSKVKAESGPLEATIEPCGNKGQFIRITVSALLPQDFAGMTVRREQRLRRGSQVEVGESEFDSQFFLDGPERLVLALLDEEMRRQIREINSEGRLEIFAGDLVVEGMARDKVAYVLRLLLEAARRLSRPMDVPQKLADNARHDPVAGVRLQNLRLLIREPQGMETREALRRACSDPSPEVRLQAARELGAEGRGVLFELAEGLEDDVISSQAVALLAPELTCERTQSIFADALNRGSLQTARACLEALGENRDPAAAEAALLSALQREEVDLRKAAASALGRVGSVAAVLPLKEAAEGSWLDLELRRAARQAITEIQSRLQGASPGQLSMAEAEGGQLSLASSETGHLSLAAEEPVVRPA